MKLPASIALDVEHALSRSAGRDVHIEHARALGGGCVSPAARLELDEGDVAFLKWADSPVPEGFFRSEAASLQVLNAAGVIRVPAVRAVSVNWLLLEWLEPGNATDTTWDLLGEQLAALHRVQGQAFGWAEDNFIGSLPQQNGWLESWPEFWRKRRLEPQLRAAYERGHFDARDRARFKLLLGRLNDALAPAAMDGPSLLHGDLWRGNVHILADDGPALIDPSSYYGHREVDIAMAELFGGLDQRFFGAYSAAWPITPGYETIRRPIYQLYYLLVHVNLFGSAYLAASRSSAAAVLDAI